jgi:hypothetical protein
LFAKILNSQPSDESEFRIDLEKNNIVCVEEGAFLDSKEQYNQVARVPWVICNAT